MSRYLRFSDNYCAAWYELWFRCECCGTDFTVEFSKDRVRFATAHDGSFDIDMIEDYAPNTCADCEDAITVQLNPHLQECITRLARYDIHSDVKPIRGAAEDVAAWLERIDR
jgi:hypothetical protein